jgi:hypothetical protein
MRRLSENEGTAKRRVQSPQREIDGDVKEDHEHLLSWRQIPHFPRQPVKFTMPYNYKDLIDVIDGGRFITKYPWEFVQIGNCGS